MSHLAAVDSDSSAKADQAEPNQSRVETQAQFSLPNMRALTELTLCLQTNLTDESQLLQAIVDTVVDQFGYVGAMIGTLEPDNRLPMRAYAIGFDPTIVTHLEEQARMALLGPKSVIYLDDSRFQDNLAVLTLRQWHQSAENLVVSDTLYDLLRPISDRSLADLAQKLTGIKQLLALPLVIESEVMGFLFVASQTATVTKDEREILILVAQQAAVAIRNARLYLKAEERRKVAQLFAKMAFSAAASIHTLRNHLSATQSYLQLLQLAGRLPSEQRQELLKAGSDILHHLNDAVAILDNLHEPWQPSQNEPVDLNECIIRAIKKVFPEKDLDLNQDKIDLGDGVVLRKSLAANLPQVKSSLDMLTEALRVLVKNAVEATNKNVHGSGLWIESRRTPKGDVEVMIHDDGIGIKPEHLGKVFEMGWSTKEGEGMGFGLFWSKEYIEGIGGTIKLESTWRQGSTFTVRLPVQTQAQQEE